VSPRFIVPFILAVLLAVPATASAAPSVCGVDLGPYAPAAQDQTAVPNSDWQPGVPAGTVDVPLAGDADVDKFEYKVDCGSAIPVNTAPGTATITGQGAIRFTHRAHDAVTDTWTDWVDEWVRIDSGAPANTTPAISTDWRKGPATFPLTATDTTSPVHTEWRVDGGSWTSSASALVNGTGAHTLDTAAVDAAGNRTERTDVVSIDNDPPLDSTDTAPVGWQNQPVSLTVDGTDAHSGVARIEWQIDAQTPGSGPDGTVVQIATQGMHVFRTRAVDRVGNASAWRAQDVWVDIAGPVDTTVVPTTWFTTPTVPIDITAEEDEYGIKSIEWRLDGQPGGTVMFPLNDTVPVTVAGDGIHQLEVRVTDNDNRVLDWHTHLVKIDTVHPTDLTTVSSGWLPYSSLNVNVRGTDANAGIERVEWRIDGADAESAPGAAHDVTVSGDGVHTLETRVVDNAGLVSAWTARTIKLDATAPTNTTPLADPGWRNTPYAVVLDGADAGSGVASVGWKVKLDGQPEGAEHVGTAGTEKATINVDGSHVLNTRVRDIGGTASAWRTELIQIDRVAPADGTVYPTAPVANRHVITFAPTDDRSGVAAVEYKLDGGAPTSASSVKITGAGDHTLAVRVRDNAGNWSAWGSHTVTVVLGPDTTAPTDNTTVPAQWVTSAWTVTVAAEDDIDGVGIDYVEWRVDDEPIRTGPAGSTFTVSTDGVHDIATRVWDKAGNLSDWKVQTLRVDTTKPVDATALPSGWAASRAVTLAASDAASGIDRIVYTVTGAGTLSGQFGAGGGTLTLPADGTYTLTYNVYDVAGQRLTRSVTYKVDTVAPVNTSAAAPTAWQTAALSLPLTGTDALSGVDHAEWRVAGGDVHTGTPAVVSTQGSQTLETRVVDKAGNASSWRAETVKVDTTKPVNTTAAVTVPWRKSTFTTTVSGSDAQSGVARTEYRVDGGSVVSGSAVSIAAEGAHTLETRVVDVAGNASDWRADAVGIDKTVPVLAVDCGPSTWRNTVPVCAVTASGGPSGLPTLTAAIGGGTPVAVTGGRFAVDADGASTITFQAVDGAGNQASARADVKVDRAPPSVSVKCAAGAGVLWVCTVTGADGLSGIGGLSWSLNGSAPAAVGPGGSFSVPKGTVVAYASDAAGNAAASPPVKLAERSAAPSGGGADASTPRSTSEAVLLRKSAKASRLVGQLSIAALPTKTTLDLRPLALGKGKFRFTFKVTLDGKRKTVTKTQTTRSGYSKRIRVTVGAGAKASVALTIARRSGKRWVTYAGATAKL